MGRALVLCHRQRNYALEGVKMQCGNTLLSQLQQTQIISHDIQLIFVSEIILKGLAGGYRVQAYNPRILEAVGEDWEFQVIPATQKNHIKQQQEQELPVATPRRKSGTTLLGIPTVCKCRQLTHMQPLCSTLTKRKAFKTLANVLFQEAISSMASFQFRNMKELAT